MQAKFVENTDDELKMEVIQYQVGLWVEIRDDVKAYSLKNWRRWEAEKPAWFDENFKAKVPDDFIPKEALDKLKKKYGGVRRRSSVMDRLSVKEGGKEAREGYIAKTSIDAK